MVETLGAMNRAHTTTKGKVIASHGWYGKRITLGQHDRPAR
jgi:hypothetical protein